MIDRESIYNDIGKDGLFRRLWHGRDLRWCDAVEHKDRNAGIFRRRAIDAACDAIDAGERDKDKIVESVCGSFVGIIIIGIVARLIINAIVSFILKRLEETEESDA